jgi:nucleoside-diphosphate-sugar epimerase
MKRVLITGAEGIVGTVLRKHLKDRYDLRLLTYAPADFPSFVADISDYTAITPAFEGMDAVIHLAAAADFDITWKDVLSSNIIGTYNIFEASRRMGVKLVVFASSNHVVGMYEEEAGPSIYELSDSRVYDAHVDVRPDSMYGVSKVFGEALGRFYSDRHGMQVICVRIGSCPPQNDPRFASVAGLNLNSDEQYMRRRAAWLSHRDCAQLFTRCLESANVRWAVVYGTSNNPRQFWNLLGAREMLGYEPEDAAPIHPDLGQ